MKNCAIAVAGGGAVALAAALAARRAGFDVARAGGAFDERRAARFFALGATSVDFLREIDAWDAAAATPVYRMRLCANDRVLDLRAARGRTLCAVIRESRLLESLQNRIGESENCEREIESITADSESIRVGLTGGTLTAKLLVAADGARSPVARLLGVAAAGKHYRQTALTALLRAQKPAANTAAQFFGRRETLGFLPVDDETTALIWSLPTEQAAAARADRDFFAARARERSRGFFGDFEIMGEIGAFPLAAVARASRCAPRVIFVGDAAQTMHPLAGQGLNLGLADARAAIDYARASADPGAPLSLAAAAKDRRRRARAMAGLVDRIQSAPPPALALAFAAAAKSRLLQAAAVAFANG